MVSSNLRGEAKWATPAAASRPASSRGERSDRGTVPPLMTCCRMLPEGRRGGAVGLHAQGVVEPGLGAPLREGHAELAAEEAAEGAFAGPGGGTEGGEGPG